ncbi:hypothetical protein [Granulibacter bethesdensis]|uniref:Uncharacterized protein n=1 Tax=Granulibacter bethesdensis (strain ATCC BAA-1260 / CGDNIH1) TaxID=391165 RepID=Q0BSG0_GRABC|nr:hypothetical protein [Granulibacter bethesdensis]ABI62242.1 Hypothetical protein GbCGDNIH1_1344 [Granulibacter bethesdensis CGDNIH1]AHJ66212.1 Hypothetical protein GbCGDNIH4_1344 [Granulibacter bethesdensis CGDNIH4]AHJ68851.1 Hypothetical protein GbCGDNIH2_1344 [Granulibacter bethesdensis]APH52068.1 Hypothetical protein GbCGDNIH5_1344 [Granulibacter bethesdensis]APH64759.1 Hypothetical protein GbCGDNIH1I4_1344 [Granulibacter bethesdensis]
MNERPDSSERKILGDIIALVLDENQGQSEAALIALKRRAARNNITGGLLKNLLHELRGQPSAFLNVEAPGGDSIRQATLEQQLTRAIMERDSARLQLSIQIQAANARRETRWRERIVGGIFTALAVSSALTAYTLLSPVALDEEGQEKNRNTAVIAPLPPPSKELRDSPATVEEAEFRAGAQDHRRMLAWLHAASAEQQSGAQYWLSRQSSSGSQSCYMVGGSLSAGWLNGCLIAQRSMEQANRNSATSVAYQRGWQSDGRSR